MKNIPDLYSHMTNTLTGRTTLEGFCDKHPRVFNPKNVDELHELQSAIVEMTTFVEFGVDDERLHDFWKTMVSIYNYFDKQYSHQN